MWMEFSQPQLPLGPEGKKPTRDFLSLYGESSFQTEDSTSTSQGFILKTHDFFHPVERITKNSNPKVDTPTSARLPTPEKIVPGKMATYNISHFPNLGIVKHEIKGSTATIGVKSTEKEFDSKERANSYNNHDTGAFTLWLEPSEKDKTPQFPQENPVKLGPWPTESSMPSFISRSSFNCQSSSKQSQKSRSGILEKMKSFKNSQEEKDEEEEYLKKERSFSEENLSFKIDANKSNQKANTPRSKHSATEQRRRSKINERFLMLRELIPHSDQKRDKASFLLEVIQYIQLLQEKVQKYETVYKEKEKDQENIFMPWKYNQELGDYSNDKPHSNKNGPIHGMTFPVSFDNGNTDLFPSNMTNTKDPLESNMNISTMYRKGDENYTLPSKMVSPSNLKNSTVIGRCNVIEEHEKRLTSDAENMASHACPQLRKRQGTSGISVNNKGNEAEELMIEGGTVHVSTSYSQGLMSTVAQTLESSGIDLSRASISVQITVGRQKTSRTPTADYGPKKDHGVRITDSGDPRPPQKKLKIDHS